MASWGIPHASPASQESMAICGLATKRTARAPERRRQIGSRRG
jgi:hypothetical protein